MVQNDCVMRNLLLALVFSSTNGFNLSPIPNIRIKEPNLKFFSAKTRSSYFGYTINLRESSVIIGAPRAQSTLESQRKINETGAIYKCTIANSTCNCKPFVFDDTGNINDTGKTLTYDSEEKNYQWLGASMDGGPKDTDKLIVCAPRLVANASFDYLMNGICYWTSDTSSDIPLMVEEIRPLRLKNKQFIRRENKDHAINALAQQGLSVLVTSKNEEIIIGVPGFHVWRGTVIRQQFRKPDVLHQTHKIKFNTEIPRSSKQHGYSYFGYSVGSGYFDSNLKNKTYYVASAPQAQKGNGEAYIFDIINIETESGNYDTINKFLSFSGLQFGEYFGYAVLAEDLNADGLTDLIVTAPQHTSLGYIERGAIYVFINKGEFRFENPVIIKSPVEGKGRFGTSISSLGDINRDGYNDFAVGAPFAGNGTVFIYLGSSKGLREPHSQELKAVPIETSWGSSPWFGYGLSKGCDVDNNGFNDFAIGAPNEELVFLYRAYPVVKIVATINVTQINPDQETINFQICYRISTESHNITSQKISLLVNLDPTYKRVTFKKMNSSEERFNETAVTDDKCFSLDANVRYNESYIIFQPIELEVHYELIKIIPDSGEFCYDCALVDPIDPKLVAKQISYSHITGCKSDECIADLKVTSSGLSPTFMIGSDMTISVTYEVTNSGESAYLPKITTTSSKKLPFSKIPTTCVYQKDDSLLCDLNQGKPMLNDTLSSITIIYDVSQIEGSSITLNATVNSAGVERNTSDNKVSNVIVLHEFTEIVAIGTTSTAEIDLHKVFNSTEIINNYEIKSSGPSKIQVLEIAFEIPIAHKFHGSTQLISLIDYKNISIQGVYNSQQLFFELYLNNELLPMNPLENEEDTIDMENENQNIFVTSNLKSVELEHNSEESEPIEDLLRSSTKQVATNNDPITAIQNKSHELLSKESLPINRTIYFSCDHPETICVRAVIKINNFLPHTSVNIRHKYNIDLNGVNKILIEPWENFVIMTKLEIVKAGDLNKNTTHIETNIENNVIYTKHLHKSEVPWLIIILAVLGGLIVLTAIIYGMHKVGFFKRKSKEEMQRLAQEQQDTAEWIDGLEKLGLEHQNVNHTEDEC